MPAIKRLTAKSVRWWTRFNQRHGTADWTPILLLRQHFTLPQVLALYRLADVCVVSALHDGMNLVAKEYVAAKNEGNGVLVLSQFTGAARELRQALLINPYDIEACADILAQALAMLPDERYSRMQALRDTVAGNNIYRWAGKVLQTLTTVPQGRPSMAPKGRAAVMFSLDANGNPLLSIQSLFDTAGGDDQKHASPYESSNEASEPPHDTPLVV